MFVIFVGFVSLLAAFLFRFSEISSYQRQANSILQNSTYIPSLNKQEHIYGSDRCPVSPVNNVNQNSQNQKGQRYQYKLHYYKYVNGHKVPKYSCIDTQHQEHDPYKSSKSTNAKLAKLDKKYDYQFMVKPINHNYKVSNQDAYDSNSTHVVSESGNTNDLSNKGHYSNGQRMYYKLEIDIPYEDLGINKNYKRIPNEPDGSIYSTNLVQAIQDPNPSIFSHGFLHNILSKVTCQVNNDNDNNNSPETN